MSQTVYRLVIEGELGPRYASAFEGMTIRARGGRTEITGPVIDQSRMQGLLERIASLGLMLRSVTPVDISAAGTAPAPSVNDELMNGVDGDTAPDRV